MICHGDNDAGVERISALLREKCGVSEIIANHAGPQVGGHCGPGLVGLFYVASHR